MSRTKHNLRAMVLASSFLLASFAPPARSLAEELLQVVRPSSVAKASEGVELIADPTFSAGFLATPKCNDTAEAACADDKRYALKSPAYAKLAAIRPVWDLRQWGSRSSFSAEATAFEGGYGWQTEDKRLVIFSDGRVEMAVNGEREMEGQYDNNRPSKPSLIAGQTIAAPGPYSRDTGPISDMDRLVFNLDFRLAYENQNKKPGYDPTKNAFSFPVNFTIQNLNSNSPGYGQYVWLQINPYDDRHEKPIRKRDESMTDYGTKMMIYFVPTDSLTSENSHSGDWITLHANILPFATRSIELAAKRGLLTSGDLSDYKIGGVNIGYELTGLNVSTVEFKNLSLQMFRRQ